MCSTSQRNFTLYSQVSNILLKILARKHNVGETNNVSNQDQINGVMFIKSRQKKV